MYCPEITRHEAVLKISVENPKGNAADSFRRKVTDARYSGVDTARRRWAQTDCRLVAGKSCLDKGPRDRTYLNARYAWLVSMRPSGVLISNDWFFFFYWNALILNFELVIMN